MGAQSKFKTKDYRFDPYAYRDDLTAIIKDIEETQEWKENSFHRILKKHPKDGNQLFGRDQILAGYNLLVSEGLITFNHKVKDKIKMKPMRTQSGVATVTVLTKPFPCPGKCIFCPNDVKMPKSYLSDEPGAQRAERNNFDPYLQTFNRLKALQNIDANPNITSEFGVMSIPTVLMLKNGKEVKRIVGLNTKEAYIEALESVKTA